MHDCMVVEFALVTYRREDIALQKRGSIENHERLIRIARENHLIKRFLYLFLALNHDVGMTGDTLFGPAG